MTEFTAQFYDGRSSAPCEARLRFPATGVVQVTLPGGERCYAVSELRVHDRVGARAPRSIEFADGAVAHVPPDPAADALLDALQGRRRRGWLRRLEARWLHALAALAVSSAVVAVLVVFGLPSLAAFVAGRVPPAFEAELGARALAELEKDWFRPSAVPLARQRELQDAFARRIASHAGPGVSLRLELRFGRRIGANALALPGGTIIVTDQLVELAGHDEELLSVMAHEAGHVVGRHGLKQVLEGLGVTLLVTAVTGDLSGPASLAAAVPAVLLHAGYSRRYERQADAYALAWADANGVARTRWTDMLARLEQASGESPLPSWLATHPTADERSRAATSGGR